MGADALWQRKEGTAMLIRSKDDVVSFSFQPEDAVSLTRFSALSTRVQPGLLELIQRAQPESAALTSGTLPPADSAVFTATPFNGVAPFLAATQGGQN